MRKEDKNLVISQIADNINEYPHFYLIDMAAMNADDTSALRRECFNAGIKLMLVKNTLLHKALENATGDFEPLYDTLKGTTAVMFCNIANVPARLLKEKVKAGVPSLKGAFVEDGIYVGVDQLEALASLKSKEEVIADILTLLQSPAKNLVSALQSGANNIHGVLKTLSERPE